MSLGGHVFNAVVWTESAVEFLSPQPKFLETVRRLHSGTAMQIVLAPGVARCREVEATFGPEAAPKVVLALDTLPDEVNPGRFPKYCAVTLGAGIEEIHRVSKEITSEALPGPLGVLIPQRGLDANFIPYAKDNILPPDQGGIQWYTVAAGESVFMGPDLVWLAEQILVHYGIDPERTLWVCRLQTESVYSVDWRVLLRTRLPKEHLRTMGEPRTRAVHVGSDPVIIGRNPEDQERAGLIGLERFIELAKDTGEGQLQKLERAVVIKQPVRLHWDCELLRSRAIHGHLRRYRDLARRNAASALAAYSRLSKAASDADGSGRFAEPVEGLAGDGALFDNKSGAISFDSYEWEVEVTHQKGAPWEGVINYFQEPLGGLWQKDRAYLARRLETPTHTILRGEEYYYNMANRPPAERLTKISDYFTKLFSVCELSGTLQGWDALWNWKLTLALCDQLRNFVLQFNWFSYQLNRNENTKSGDATRLLARSIGEATDAAVGLYYSVLLRSRPKALEYLEKLYAVRGSLKVALDAALNSVEEIGKARNGDMVFTEKFVRRWREADHPGENLLLAIQAVEFCQAKGISDVLAVGISWGGIELPLVFKHTRVIAQPELPVPGVLVADYSHYRKDPESEYRAVPYIQAGPASPNEPTKGSHVLIFDDNALTGLTIQHVHDDLVRRGCEVVGVFVTRLSGGRRYGQMRMKGHGVLNPELVDTLVHGFLGETPFALTWSREKYENPIGVFSLARRRILELLYANSSVERYDREGF